MSISSKLGRGWVLNSTVGYSYTDFLDDPNIASKYISNYARHLVNGVVALRRGSFEGAITGLWKQRQSDSAESISAFKSADYSLWNAKVSYRITDSFTVGIQVDNLFDAEYQDILGARMPGRWAWCSISWTL
jgi:iron complex outermembrane receptor protein